MFGETGSILGECWSDDIGYKLCSTFLPLGRLVGDFQLEEGITFKVRGEIPIKLIKDPGSTKPLLVSSLCSLFAVEMDGTGQIFSDGSVAV